MGSSTLVAFDSKVSRKEDLQCWWASIWCGDGANFLMECCLGEVTGSIEVVAVEMAVGVVVIVVLADSGILYEVVILVQLVV